MLSPGGAGQGAWGAALCWRCCSCSLLSPAAPASSLLPGAPQPPAPSAGVTKLLAMPQGRNVATGGASRGSPCCSERWGRGERRSRSLSGRARGSQGALEGGREGACHVWVPSTKALHTSGHKLPKSWCSEPKSWHSEPKLRRSEPKSTLFEPKSTPSEPKVTPSEPKSVAGTLGTAPSHPAHVPVVLPELLAAPGAAALALLATQRLPTATVGWRRGPRAAAAVLRVLCHAELKIWRGGRRENPWLGSLFNPAIKTFIFSQRPHQNPAPGLWMAARAEAG